MTRHPAVHRRHCLFLLLLDQKYLRVNDTLPWYSPAIIKNSYDSPE